MSRSRGNPSRADFAANTNVLEHGGRTLALVEAGAAPYELTHDLDTVGPHDFCGTRSHLPGKSGYTAHPHEDPATGELHALSYSWLRGNRVDYSVLDTDGRVRRSIDDPGPRQPDDARLRPHREATSSSSTCRSPSTSGRRPPTCRDWSRPMVRGLLDRIIGRNPVPEPLIAFAARGGDTGPTLPYRWNPDYPARIGVLPRDGRRRRRPLVRDRPLLHLPHAQRLRRRRHRRGRRGEAPPDVRAPCSPAPTRGRRR